MSKVRSYTVAEPSGTNVLLDPSFPYREELLQFIWEQRLFDPLNLTSADGEPVDVLKPGRLHKNTGPDLVDAQVRIGGQHWAGNVEVHVRSSEWYAHAHEKDPAYNNVVLHVVYEHDMEVRTHAGVRVPAVELKDRIPFGRLETFKELMHAQAWVPCAPQFGQVAHDRFPIWLERVLIERLERKCAEVEALHDRLKGDAMETFWHVLARGFGFKVNAEPFGMLAEALPLRVLLKYRDDPERTEALLFGQAGLLRIDFLDQYPRLLQEEHRALSALHGLSPAPLAAWQFGRLRPPNFPTVRLAQLARLIARSDGGFSDLTGSDDPATLLRFLRVEADGYWLTHHGFDRSGTPGPKRLGMGSAQGLIINAIVPYLFAMGRILGRDELGERAMLLLERLPAEQNSIVQGWAALGVQVDTAARSQALIELKNIYCGQRRCLSCVIGTDLLKRNAFSTKAQKSLEGGG
ncbi:MAG: DUF2851 family protein [Bacteroidetes bacterium]|nr:DUF2851 family protein [Bacteroidota bacterium]HMU12714.1 DUF2851 family protein [Flavobacteriales bacterium]